MIKRGPEPEGNFQILPNATARDTRLSFRARGLLTFMLSFPPDWKFNRDWLARQSDGEGVTAVRTALQELEAAGYLVRRRIQVNGRFTWEQIIYRTAQKPAGESTGGKPSSEGPDDGNPPSYEYGDENSYEDDMTCVPHSQAHADATIDEPDRDDELSWRQQDLDLFRELLGNAVESDGSRWRKGIFDIEHVYIAFRKHRGKKWPGRWLQHISDRDGLEYWYIDEGMTPAETGGR